MSFVAWKHTENLAQLLVTDPAVATRLGDPVFGTEKLDGSNLGIRLTPAAEGWALVALVGRNSSLWEPAAPWVPNGPPPPALNYGNAGALDALPLAMHRVASRIADRVGPRGDIVVYGEAFRATVGGNGRQAQRQPRASWHPFGYTIVPPPGTDPEETPATRTYLTPDVHALFRGAAEHAPGAAVHGLDFQEYLVAAEQHVVCPPPVLYHGPLGGAAALKPALLNAPPQVEGVFFSGAVYGKWKTPMHEEQAACQTLEELAASQRLFAKTGRSASRIVVREAADQLSPEEVTAAVAPHPQLVALFTAVTDVLKAKCAKVVIKAPKVKAHAGAPPPSPAVLKVRAAVATALARELGKDPVLAEGALGPLSKAERKVAADRVVKNVAVEVAQQAADAGEPAEPAVVGRETKLLVVPAVMNDDLAQFRP